jgi:hypothetical protein
MFHKKKVVEKIKTHILCSATSFRKSCNLGDNFEKCGGAREAHKRRHNMAPTSFMMDKQGYMHACARTRPGTRTHTHTHTHTQVCNINCSSKTKVIHESSVLHYTYIVCIAFTSYHIIYSAACFGLRSNHHQAADIKDKKFNNSSIKIYKNILKSIYRTCYISSCCLV